jgi:hypothetical protein
VKIGKIIIINADHGSYSKGSGRSKFVTPFPWNILFLTSMLFLNYLKFRAG